jgi:hypothetical protein
MDYAGLVGFVGDWRLCMKSAARRARQYSWLVPSLSVTEGKHAIDTTSSNDKDELWSLRRARLSLSAEITSAALMISLTNVAGERMCVVGSWQDCIFDISTG